jgi:predicted oxidoreductase
MATRREFLMQTAACGVLATAETQLAQAVAADAADSMRRMKTYSIPHTDLLVSRIGYGCADLVDWNRESLRANVVTEAARVVKTAYDNGITFFDLADIYCFGKAEEAFGQILKHSPGFRDRIVIQSKCGKRLDPYRVDCSREHIVSSAEGSLRRLGIDYLDIFLLHVPDALVEPEQVAEAFDRLQSSGKVRYFGVSNYSASQLELLRKNVRQPLVANQVQLGLARAHLLAEDYTIDYCRLHQIQIQAYSPVRGILKLPADATPQAKNTARVLAELATKKSNTPSAVALAWLLHHPAGIAPIIGSTKPEHVAENCRADDLTLSREEWYSLFTSATAM